MSQPTDDKTIPEMGVVMSRDPFQIFGASFIYHE